MALALFSPFTIGSVTLNNRFVMPAMQRGAGKHFAPSSEMNAYYRSRVEGGVSLLITESTMIDHPSATGNEPYKVALRGDTAHAWRACIKEVKAAGGRILIQLAHEGATRREFTAEGSASYPTLSPSGLIRTGETNGVPASVAEIQEILDSYVRAALLAEELGADGIELHAGHGYLLDQFLWASTNLRQDQFGGPTLVERAKFPAQVVASIRSVVRESFLISFRLSQWKERDYEARPFETPDELKQLIELLRLSGVDIFNVSTRRFYEPEWPPSQLGLAGWVKSFTDACVITVGSVGLNIDVMDTFYTEKPVENTVLRSIEALEARLVGGEFDLVAVGRSLLADRNWVRKVAEGRYDEIVLFHRDVMKTMTDNWEAYGELDRS